MATEFLDKTGLTYLWGKLKSQFAPKVHDHKANEIQPVASKTYTGVIASANNYANGTFYYGTVMPTSFYTTWGLRYRVEVSAAGQDQSHAIADLYVFGTKDALQATSSWNIIENTSYYPAYNNSIYRAKEAGINAGYGHALGVRIYSSWNPTTAANARTIKVDILECINCTFSFYANDAIYKYSQIPGTGTTNYSGNSDLNFTGQGLQETGDSNTIDDPIGYVGAKTGSKGIWATSLIMRNADGLFESVCTAADGTVVAGNRTVEKTKIANTNGFLVGGTINFTNTTYNANSNISGNNVVYNGVSLFDSRYTLNTELVANCLTPYQNIYLTGTIHNDGLYYLDTVWWTQTPTDTSKVYVLIGGCYDSTTSNCRISLYQHNPWLTYDGTKLVPLDLRAWTAYQKPSGGIPSTDLAESYYLASNPSGYTSNAGTITGVSANGTSVATSGVANIPAASTSAYGVTKLSDSTSTTSSVLAATPTAVKAAYDLANGKYSKPSTGIPKTDLASAVQTSLGKADSAYQKPSTGIPSTDMASAVTTSLGKADTAYQKPSTGIPKTDLASAVQTSLGKADSAYQKPSTGIPSTDLAESYYLASNPSGYTSNAGTITGVSANGTSVATSGVANIPAASTSAYGVTKLSDSTSTTSSVLAATPTAVKAAYDLANGKYSKPSGGIPKTDLASAVQTSLGKADTAYQKPSGGIPGTDLADTYAKTPVRITIASVSSLPSTVTGKTEITADMVVQECVLSNPLAQISDWTVTTTAGGLTVSGSISGTTDITLILSEVVEVS